MHLIRNSIDHGIESPELRASQGKPSLGKLCLRRHLRMVKSASRSRMMAEASIPKRSRQKALALGLRTATELQRMSQRELYALILLPGFSTAKQVTDVSGRGVGMGRGQDKPGGTRGNARDRFYLGKRERRFLSACHSRWPSFLA